MLHVCLAVYINRPVVYAKHTKRQLIIDQHPDKSTTHKTTSHNAIIKLLSLISVSTATINLSPSINIHFYVQSPVYTLYRLLFWVG